MNKGKANLEKEKIEAYKKSLDQIAMIVITDSTGKVLEVNKNFERISEYTCSELIGSTHELFIPPSESFVKKVQSGQVWRGEIKNKSKTGRSFWLDATVTPLKNSREEINAYMVICFDITNKKQQEKTIKKQQQQIVEQARLSSLGEMAGGIAHEINNPLAVISATMKTIRKMITRNMVGTDDFNEALDDIDETVVRITNIVTGLKNISRDSTNDSFNTCKITDIINDVLPLCSAKFKNKEINLEVDIAKELEHLKINVMRVPMSQVLLNLLTNAYDEISDKNDEAKWIKIKAALTPGKDLSLEVTDSGKGIPQEIQPRIFQPFFTTKEVGKGTGLGLSLSHSIVKKHGGEFYINNESANTCFAIKLPTKQKDYNERT